MAWLEVHQSLLTHRKTLKAAGLLSIRPVYLIGHLISFWLWALDNAPDGELADISARIIALAANWEGEADALVTALVEAGFFDRGDNGELSIHDWGDYTGRLLDRRQANAERQRRFRERQQPRQAEPSNAHVTRDVTVMCGATVPNTTVPNTTGHDHVEPSPQAVIETVSSVPGKRSRRPSTTGTPPGFEKFWERYPRRVARAMAERAFSRAIKQGVDPETLATAAGHYAGDCQRRGTEEQYVMHATTFIGQDRWRDYEQMPNAPPPKSNGRPVDTSALADVSEYQEQASRDIAAQRERLAQLARERRERLGNPDPAAPATIRAGPP